MLVPTSRKFTKYSRLFMLTLGACRERNSVHKTGNKDMALERVNVILPQTSGGNETGYISSFANLLRNTRRETNHLVKEETRTCSLPNPTPNPKHTPDWTTTRRCANCP